MQPLRAAHTAAALEVGRASKKEAVVEGALRANLDKLWCAAILPRKAPWQRPEHLEMHVVTGTRSVVLRTCLIWMSLRCRYDATLETIRGGDVYNPGGHTKARPLTMRPPYMGMASS